MTSISETSFDARIGRLTEKHRRMSANGVSLRIDRNGLMTAHAMRPRPQMPWKALGLTLVMALLFKLLVLVSLGADDYSARLAPLQTGTVAERAGAWLMQPDPVTAAVAGWAARR